jgi:hypothetical protein
MVVIPVLQRYKFGPGAILHDREQRAGVFVYIEVSAVVAAQAETNETAIAHVNHVSVHAHHVRARGRRFEYVRHMQECLDIVSGNCSRDVYAVYGVIGKPRGRTLVQHLLIASLQGFPDSVMHHEIRIDEYRPVAREFSPEECRPLPLDQPTFGPQQEIYDRNENE